MTGKVQPVNFGMCSSFAGQPANLTGSPRLTTCLQPPALVKKSANATPMYGARTSTVTTTQGLLNVTKSGVFDAKTRSSLKPSGITWHATSGRTVQSTAAYGAAHHLTLLLGPGSVGKPVEFLQVALHMARVDRNGYFATATKAAAIAFQKAHGVAETGRVTNLEWMAL